MFVNWLIFVRMLEKDYVIFYVKKKFFGNCIYYISCNIFVSIGVFWGDMMNY